jgi:N utilization substance protein A
MEQFEFSSFDLPFSTTYLYIGITVIIFFLFIIGALFIVRSILHGKAKTGKAFNRTILLIRVPKERKTETNGGEETINQIREQIAVTENMFAAIAGLHEEHGFSTWLYGRNDHMAFEIVVKDNKISFYVAMPEKIKDFIEQQIHAQYPYAEISEEPDYNIFKPQSHAVGAYLWFKHQSAFPFKNYQKMDSDPLVAILNPLSKVLENEGAIIQYIVRPAGSSWRKSGLEIIKQLREGKKLEEKPLFDPEKHIMISDAKRIKKDVQLNDEMVFPLEAKDDYGRIAAQTAKQVIMQKIREAEKTHIVEEYGKREGEVVSGTVQRIERGNIFVDMGRATGLLPYEEQIPGEHFAQGERVRAYLFRVEESGRGVFLRLSRSHPKFLEELFKAESPEVANGSVIIKSIAREAGSRSKVAVATSDSHIDPVGSMVGQRGVRVATITSELGGEKIDVIEWSEDPKKYIEDALSPAKVLKVDANIENRQATVEVSEDQQSLAIGKGGQNVRLAAKLTGWKIDIRSVNPFESVGTEEYPDEAEEEITPRHESLE